MNRSRGTLIVCLYIGYVLVATLHPFEFSANFSQSVTQLSASFRALTSGDVRWLGTNDFVINILPFVPFGILLYYVLDSTERPRLTTILLVSACGGLLSFLIELCQGFFAGRHSSAFDILANTLGTICGALLSSLYPGRIADLACRFWGKVEGARVPLFSVLLWGVFPCLYFAALFPWLTFHNWNAHLTFQIGNETAINQPWLGKIYLTALYNRALSPDEVTHHFRLGFSPEEVLRQRVREGLVALYAFSEGAGTTIYDISSFKPSLDLTFFPESHIRWLHTSNGIEILQPATIKSQGPAKKLFDALRATDALSIEVWITPAGIAQRGPAHIVSFSRGARERNFTLGQLGADLYFRLRTPITGNNGGPPNPVTKDNVLTPETFHIVATYEKGFERLYINGSEYLDSFVDLKTAEVIGFAAKKAPIAQIAYSFFYFFPVSFYLAIFFLRRSRGFSVTWLLPIIIGTSLLSITEVFQALVFERDIDLPLIGYGIMTGIAGVCVGVVWAR